MTKKLPHLAQPLRGENLLLLVRVEEGEGLPQALDILHSDQWEVSIRSRDQCWLMRGEYIYLHGDLPVQTRSFAVAPVHVMPPMTPSDHVTPGVPRDVTMALTDARMCRMWAPWPGPRAWRAVPLLAGPVVPVPAAAVVVNWHFVLRFLKQWWNL